MKRKKKLTKTVCLRLSEEMYSYYAQFITNELTISDAIRDALTHDNET